MKMTPPAISSFLCYNLKTGPIINYINHSFDKTEQEQEYPNNSKGYL